MPVFESNVIRTREGFPSTVEMVSQGIAKYRAARGIENRGNFPYATMTGVLRGKEFTVPTGALYANVLNEKSGEYEVVFNGFSGHKTFRITEVSIGERNRIAEPIAPIGDVEMMPELVIPSVAAAIAAFPFLGNPSGEKLNKTAADNAATFAMRDAMNNISMKGTIKGGEGGGRDAMDRGGALFLGEPVGTGYGIPVDFLVDPLEVTNQGKKLKRDGGDKTYKLGEGWSPELEDPALWYPGYSGALTLMAAVNANGSRGGFRKLTDDLYLNKFFLPWYLAGKGLNINSSAEEIINIAAEVFQLNPDQLVAAALGRSRHTHTFKTWVDQGMLDSNIIKPTDGDSMFGWGLAAEILHLAGLTGGVMEGVIGALPADMIGADVTCQFASHYKLGQEKDNADLLDPDHKFGFYNPEVQGVHPKGVDEYNAMVIAELYDQRHMGSIIRRLAPTSHMWNFIVNAAYAEKNIPGFDRSEFLKHFEIISDPDKYFGIPDNEKPRFSEVSRNFLMKVFEQRGWHDVTKVSRLGDFRFSRDGMYLVTALTPNKWAPLLGIREENGGLVAESLFAGGSSQTAFILETHLKEI